MNQCLRGVAQQEGVDYELILVDYMMDPPALEWHLPWATFGETPTHIVRWDNPDPCWNDSRARNIGLANAKADRVVFLNSDCVMMPGLLAGAMAALDEDPSRQVYWQRWDLTNEGLTWFLEGGDEAQVGEFHDKTTYGDFLAVERDVVMDLGGYEERCMGWGVYDHDLACRLDRAGRPRYWGEMPSLVHLWHPVRPGRDEDWRRNIDCCSEDFHAGKDVRNDGRGTFERYVVGN